MSEPYLQPTLRFHLVTVQHRFLQAQQHLDKSSGKFLRAEREENGGTGFDRNGGIWYPVWEREATA